MGKRHTIREVEQAVAPIAQSLASDGYELVVEESNAGELRLRITAGPDACEECLVPQSVMRPMLQSSLETIGVLETGWQLRYPVGS